MESFEIDMFILCTCATWWWFLSVIFKHVKWCYLWGIQVGWGLWALLFLIGAFMLPMCWAMASWRCSAENDMAVKLDSATQILAILFCVRNAIIQTPRTMHIKWSAYPLGNTWMWCGYEIAYYMVWEMHRLCKVLMYDCW